MDEVLAQYKNNGEVPIHFSTISMFYIAQTITLIIITMHFLPTLVLSALYVSATVAVTIPGGGCAGKKDVEVTIKINHEQPIAKGAGVGVSEQSVFSMINSPS